ncbi:UDP-3-O-(3-hydroxymyristoyl)glucosamine N-acyltransferase [Neolewinella antarctica]|uniref:UDP-3-O-acylglucosamine N-acyltransferase n=1 Tax=Neolewinella antarctica TaxID=442734 RepID=A0ABX0X6Z9_9BACT|nr:UDP-3-O-(3-hydroxymyristoyl)glucosamine N-acyltransferase [Neolewinella antarctica]NJC24632.1 UDP-3-O-[3-hydroxymyristoyl] glucosamine N-acyltransferase [Neolewinella antarctica]
MNITVAELAKLIGATVEGDPAVTITGPSQIEAGKPGTITFLGNPAYEKHLYDTGASAVLVQQDFVAKQRVDATLLRVENVYLTVSQLLAHFQTSAVATVATGVSEHAIVDGTARLSEHVAVGKLSIVEAGASVGSGTVIHAQVYVGENTIIGENCVLHPGVKLMKGCVLGDNCVLHPNVVIGADGFGFAPDPATGRFNKIPQVGNVVVESDVEIGANTCVDRASIGSTIIRRGVKLDNLIQIAHNVEIGEDTVIAALTGIAGSTKLGSNCMIGGQVGIAGHKVIADGTKAQAQTGITHHIREPGREVAGTPFMPWSGFKRSAALYKMLPEIVLEIRNRLRKLETESNRED